MKAHTEQPKPADYSHGRVRKGSDRESQLFQDYLVICRVLEASLSKDLSTFFSSMNVFCQVTFKNTKVIWDEVPYKVQNLPEEVKKQTDVATGQTPQWQATFSFGFQRLSKYG